MKIVFDDDETESVSSKNLDIESECESDIDSDCIPENRNLILIAKLI